MGWLIFGIYLFCVLMFHLFRKASEEWPAGSQQKRVATIGMYIMIGIVGLIALGLIFYAIGWIWYYICGGFLLFEDQPFWDKVFCGALSVVVLVILIGGVRVILGFDKGDW